MGGRTAEGYSDVERRGRDSNSRLHAYSGNVRRTAWPALFLSFVILAQTFITPLPVDICPQMTKKRWTVEFSDEDWLSIELDVTKGKVTGLVLNYLAHIDDEIREVVRYDTDHGYLHRHRFWLSENKQVHDLEDPKNPSTDYGAVFQAAADDLRANWSAYRSKLQRTIKRKR
jgi:hypothetical protein